MAENVPFGEELLLISSAPDFSKNQVPLFRPVRWKACLGVEIKHPLARFLLALYGRRRFSIHRTIDAPDCSEEREERKSRQCGSDDEWRAREIECRSAF